MYSVLKWHFIELLKWIYVHQLGSTCTNMDICTQSEADCNDTRTGNYNELCICEVALQPEMVAVVETGSEEVSIYGLKRDSYVGHFTSTPLRIGFDGVLSFEWLLFFPQSPCSFLRPKQSQQTKSGNVNQYLQ